MRFYNWTHGSRCEAGHDLERMRGGPEDAYAAFDFFVTADHIVDWLLPDWPDSSQPAGLARENIM